MPKAREVETCRGATSAPGSLDCSNRSDHRCVRVPAFKNDGHERNRGIAFSGSPKEMPQGSAYPNEN